MLNTQPPVFVIRLLRRPTRGVAPGFTLIELLIVIAIIGILAAILFPVFARARDNARRSACQSNLKQIGLGIMQYTQDYDETMPITKDDSNTASIKKSWQQLVDPYIKSAQIFRCPNDSVKRTQFSTRSYAMPDEGREMFITGTNSGSTDLGRKLAAIPAPATTLMVVESHSESNWLGSESGASVASPDAQLGTGATSGNMHFDGWNYLFVDGHVKWFLPAQTAGTLGARPSGFRRNGIQMQCATEARQTSGSAYYACGYWTVYDRD